MDIKSIIEKLGTLIDPANNFIEITNIATVNDGDDFLLNKTAIILSIVNIEEDKTLRNLSLYKEETNNETTVDRYTHPTKHLIISLLFSSYNKVLTNYLDGIDKLKNVINFFQQNTSLYFKNDNTELLTYTAFLAKTDVQQKNYSKITFESVSLSMDQLSQMWTYLGSRYMPSVLFKMRLVTVQTSTIEQDSVIKEIRVNLWENNQNDPAGLLETKIHPPEE
jgi:hypothetical protein